MNGRNICWLGNNFYPKEETKEPSLTLDDFLLKKPPFEDRYNFLQQICQCILRLHNEKFVCGQVPGSDISVVKKLAPSSNADLNCNETKKQCDISFLANLYSKVLTNQKYTDAQTETHLDCNEPDIALDVIEKMTKNEITIEEIIRHPFHWNCFQKVHFFCRVVDYINGEKNKSQNDLIRALNETTKNVIPGDNWVDKLKLKTDEIKRLVNKKKAAAKDNKIEPGRDLIVNKVKSCVGQDENKKKSVFELLRFFRNRYCHFPEDAADVRACFGCYPEGYWKFFSSRFPKLFMHVYNEMQSYICTSDGKGFEYNKLLNHLQHSSWFAVIGTFCRIKNILDNNQSRLV